MLLITPSIFHSQDFHRIVFLEANEIYINTLYIRMICMRIRFRSKITPTFILKRTKEVCVVTNAIYISVGRFSLRDFSRSKRNLIKAKMPQINLNCDLIWSHSLPKNFLEMKQESDIKNSIYISIARFSQSDFSRSNRNLI